MRKYLLFALAGYAIGILCAPKEGALLRRELKERLRDLQKKGARSLEDVQLKSEELAEKASLAFDKAKEQASILRNDGEELARSASANLQEAYTKTQLAVQRTSEKAAATTAPIVSQVNGQAREFKKQVDDYFLARNVRRIGEQMTELERKNS